MEFTKRDVSKGSESRKERVREKQKVVSKGERESREQRERVVSNGERVMTKPMRLLELDDELREPLVKFDLSEIAIFSEHMREIPQLLRSRGNNT